MTVTILLEASRLDDMSGGGADGQMWSEMAAEGLEANGDAWGFFGGDLEVRPTGLDEFFRYERTSVGGESQKRDLRTRLAVFQILEN